MVQQPLKRFDRLLTRVSLILVNIIFHAPMGETPNINCPSQETEVTSKPTRPVQNVVITTKGLQDRNMHILDGMTVENKGKTIN